MTGAQSARVYDLWIASGKPERLGYVATGGYVDAGVRWVAAGGAYCAGGVLGLRLSRGRLYGKWCGADGVSVPVVSVPQNGWGIHSAEYARGSQGSRCKTEPP